MRADIFAPSPPVPSPQATNPLGRREEQSDTQQVQLDFDGVSDNEPHPIEAGTHADEPYTPISGGSLGRTSVSM